MSTSSIGSFFGLSIGASALAAAQAEENVAGNNIANDGTVGYTVETTNLVQGIPVPSAEGSPTTTLGQFGSGVQVASITRTRDQFLDTSYRNANSQENTDQSLNTALSTAQAAFDEPGTNGINGALTTFFNDFSNVQNNPTDLGVRATAIGDAGSLAQLFNTTQANLTTANTQLSAQATSDIAQVNTDGQQIATLNSSIRSATLAGQQPNTLMDQRDQLLDQLSALTNITTQSNSDGTVNVSIGSTSLVTGASSATVNLGSLQSRGDLTEGELAGLTQAQSSIGSYQSSLDTLASTVITQVNSLQQGGMGLDGSTGIPLFTGTNASTMGVNQTLVNNPQKLAAAAFTSASSTPPPGDGSNAGLIANLATSTLASGPLAGNTISGAYTTLVTSLASQISTSSANQQVASATVQQVQTQRQAVSGVSLDQEMTDMLQYQRSYQAAAQIVNVNDGMMNTLINTMFVPI